MKKINILIVLLFITVSFMVAEKENKTFPGVFGFEDSSEFDYDSVGKIPKVSSGWADMYISQYIGASISFPIKFYTIKPWVGDYFELYLNYDASQDISVNPVNNFVFGFDNSFEIEKVMNIGINFELRVLSNLLKGGQADGLELRFSPNLDFSGEYDFGLSWGINQYFEMYFYPNSTGIFTHVEFEGTYTIGYEFFHFFAPENVSGGFFAKLYLWARVFNPATSSNAPEIINLDPVVGFNFDFYGFAPFVGFYFHAQGDTIPLDTFVGLNAGFEFSKNIFTFSLGYTGRINTIVGSEWENHVDSAVSISL